MKNKKLLSEIKNISQIMGYDTSKTLSEQQSYGLPYTIKNLPTGKILSRSELGKYMANYVDALDGWVTVQAVKDTKIMAKMLSNSFYSDEGQFKRRLKSASGNYKDINVVEEDGKYYYPAFAYVDYLYQEDEGGDEIIDDIASIGTTTWSATESQLKLDAEDMIRKVLSIKYKTKAEIKKDKVDAENLKKKQIEDEKEKQMEVIFKKFPCFYKSIKTGKVTFKGVHRNNESESENNYEWGINYVNPEDKKTYRIYESGTIWLEEDGQVYTGNKIGKIDCNVNENTMNEQFDVVNDSGEVVQKIDGNVEGNVDGKIDGNVDDKDKDKVVDGDTGGYDDVDKLDCTNLKVSDEMSKIIEMIKDNNSVVLMVGSHANESKYKGTKDLIELIQCTVGAKQDGLFGSETKGKVESFQTKHKLKKDGIVGKNTISKMIDLKLINL